MMRSWRTLQMRACPSPSHSWKLQPYSNIMPPIYDKYTTNTKAAHAMLNLDAKLLKLNLDTKKLKMNHFYRPHQIFSVFFPYYYRFLASFLHSFFLLPI